MMYSNSFYKNEYECIDDNLYQSINPNQVNSCEINNNDV